MRSARALACLAGGAALALCLPKPGLCFLAWLAPAVLLIALSRARSLRESAALAGTFGFAFFVVAFYWIFLTCRFAKVPFAAALLAWAALCAVLAVSWALYGALAFRLKRLPEPALPWALAALWAAVEYAGARWTPRLGVDLLAYTQWKRLALIQGGSVFGPHGLGFLIMLWNACLAGLWLNSRSKRAQANAALSALLIAGWFGYGKSALARRAPQPGGASVEILQPDIDQYSKWDGKFEQDILHAFEDLLARPRAAAPALVIWPESSLPGWLGDPELMPWLSSLSARVHAPMLVGVVASYGGHNYNSAAWMNASGQVEGLYNKRQLVPFGEFVPFRRWLQGWIGVLAQLGDFTPGDPRQRLWDAGFGKIAVTICYEAAFPRWALVDSSRGARVFVNITNDGWYRDTAAPYFDFYANMFRAVENRVFVLRAANTGVSGAIDPYGVILARTALGERARLNVRLPANDPFPQGSFYSRHGDWFGILCLLTSIAFFFYSVVDYK